MLQGMADLFLLRITVYAPLGEDYRGPVAQTIYAPAGAPAAVSLSILQLLDSYQPLWETSRVVC